MSDLRSMTTTELEDHLWRLRSILSVAKGRVRELERGAQETEDELERRAKLTGDQGIVAAIERARKMQQEHEQQHDVQLELNDRTEES